MFKYSNNYVKLFFNVKCYRNIQKKSYSIKLNEGVRKQIGAGGFILLSVPVVTFCLGTWQVKRRKWKLGLIEKLAERTSAEPVELPADLNELNDLEYRKVKVRGRFDHSKEVYLHPRTLIRNEKEKGGALFSSGQNGAHVITPFHLADRDLTILINRGWVPKKKIDPQKRPLGQVEGEVELVGIVRHSEKRAPFMHKNERSGKFFLLKDVETIAERCQTAPVFLDAVETGQFPEGPVGGQTQVTLRNEHLSYIFTWYSLSAATSYMWYKKFIHPLK